MLRAMYGKTQLFYFIRHILLYVYNYVSIAKGNKGNFKIQNNNNVNSISKIHYHTRITHQDILLAGLLCIGQGQVAQAT